MSVDADVLALLADELFDLFGGQRHALPRSQRAPATLPTVAKN